MKLTIFAFCLLSSCLGMGQHSIERTFNSSVVEAKETYVLVDSLAFLYIHPTSSSEVVAPFNISALKEQSHEQRRSKGLVAVYRLVAEHGDFLEIETIPEPACIDHCYTGERAFSGKVLRLYVPKTTQAMVTTKPIRKNYSDGTYVELSSGVLLIPMPDLEDTYQAVIDGIQIKVNLSSDAVGNSYIKTQQQIMPVSDEYIPVENVKNGGLELNGRSIRLLYPEPH